MYTPAETYETFCNRDKLVSTTSISPKNIISLSSLAQMDFRHLTNITCRTFVNSPFSRVTIHNICASEGIAYVLCTSNRFDEDTNEENRIMLIVVTISTIVVATEWSWLTRQNCHWFKKKPTRLSGKLWTTLTNTYDHPPLLNPPPQPFLQRFARSVQPLCKRICDVHYACTKLKYNIHNIV